MLVDLFLPRNAKQMPEAVRDAIRDAVVTHGGRSEEEAENYMRDLDKYKRYQAETWS